MRVDRRTLLVGLGLPWLAAADARAASPEPDRPPGIAVTIDDFDLSDTPLMSGSARDTAILAALDRHHIKAGGFVAGKYVDALVAPQVLGNWSDQGHLLGNHSFAHRYFNGQDPDALLADILRCEALLSGYAGYRRLFRFPYLAEGRTAQGRDRMRQLLAENGYRNAHVTIDTSDWYIDNRLRARLSADPAADIAPYRQYFLDHVWDRAVYYDGLAKRLFGRSIDHTILLHHRLTTGLFLDDMLAMFAARGWRLVDASTAFSAPEFALQPPALPAGQSLLWSAARSDDRLANDLRFPGEDGAYEAAAMDALHL